MNLGIFGFGHGGCSLADELKRFDENTSESMCVYVTGFDTDAQHLASNEHLTSTALFGQQKFNGKGSDVDIEPVVEEARYLEDTFLKAAKQAHKRDTDGFLLIGSLGGGTGGGALPVCANVLANNFPTKPVYAVGILPSQREPDVMTLNASRAIQAWVDKTDNVILFDNDELGVGIPHLTDGIDEDSVSGPEMFENVNENITRTLHFVFTVDDRRESTDNDQLAPFVPSTETLIDVFSCGGMSMVTYTADTLPKAAWPGIRGSLYGLYETLTTEPEQQEQQSTDEQAAAERRSQDDVSIEDPVYTGTDERSKNDGKESNESLSWDEAREVARPHPSDLLPVLFTDQALSCGTDPRLCTHSYTLLIGQEQLLNTDDINTVSEWMNDIVDAKVVDAGLYPIESKQIAAVHISAGIGIQSRIQNLHSDAEIIAERILTKQEKTREPKKTNQFDNYDTSIPPAL